MIKFAYRPYHSGGVKWIDIDVTSMPGIEDYVKQDQWVYDADGGGEFEGYFATIHDVEKVTRYWKYTNEFYWTGWETEDRWLENEFTFTEVTAEEAGIPSPRDWLDVSQKQYPQPDVWPPKPVDNPSAS